jgi:hypothetical protein
MVDALSGRYAGLFVTSGSALSIGASPIALEAKDGTTRKEYGIPDGADSLKRFLNYTQAPEDIIEHSTDGSTWAAISGTDYTFAHAGTRIYFDTARGATDQYRIKATTEYFPMAGIIGAKEWSIEFDQDMQEVPVFRTSATDSIYKQKAPMLIGVRASISRWWNDGNFRADFLNRKFAVTLIANVTSYANKLGPRYEGWGYLTKDSIKAAANGLLEEDLEIEIDGAAFFMQ